MLSDFIDNFMDNVGDAVLGLFAVLLVTAGAMALVVSNITAHVAEAGPYTREARAEMAALIDAALEDAARRDVAEAGEVLLWKPGADDTSAVRSLADFQEYLESYCAEHLGDCGRMEAP